MSLYTFGEDFSVMNGKKISMDGDVPFVDDGQGEKVYSIPVQWLVTDVVKIRANSLEEAVKTFMEEEPRIPIGTEPSYVDGTHQISVCCEQYVGNEAQIVKELEDNFGEYLEHDYDDEDYEERE